MVKPTRQVSKVLEPEIPELTLRVALYVRVSTDMQMSSIENQILFLTDLASRKSGPREKWDIVKVYEDAGVSGTSITRREAVKQLLADARRGMYDVVMFKGISRFSRNTLDFEKLMRQLVKYTRVISAEESIDCPRGSDIDFILKIHAMMAEQESDKIGVRVRIGFDEMAKRGLWPHGNPPYGYLVDKETNRLVPHPEQAPIVQMLFHKTVYENMGLRQLSQYLNSLGMFTNKGALWRPTSLHRLLKNPVYTGKIVYGRTRTVKEYDEEDVAVRKRPKKSDDPIVVTNAHEPLVDELTFAQAQKRLDERNCGGAKGYKVGSRNNLLAGILRCPVCGHTMNTKHRGTYEGKKYSYYVCGRKLRFGVEACDSPNFIKSEADELVVETLKMKLSSYSYEELRERLGLGTKLKESPSEVLLKQIDKRLEEIELELLNANQSHAKGLLSDALFSKLSSKLDKEYRANLAEKQRLSETKYADINMMSQLDAFDKAVQKFKTLNIMSLDVRQAQGILLQLMTSACIREDEVELTLRFEI